MTATDQDDDRDRLAADYALGTLDAEARRAVEQAMAADPDLATQVEAWEARLAPLAAALPEVAPPPDLLARLEARVRREQRRRPVEATVFAEEGAWEAVAIGVRIKVLSIDAEAGTRSFLLSMDAGTRLPAHRHASVEECMMISGDLVLGDLALKAGDYHRIAAGTHHPTGFSRTGCIAFIRGDTEVQAA
jgi:anti-sigma factor ChrR (cupin superfamily)